MYSLVAVAVERVMYLEAEAWSVWRRKDGGKHAESADVRCAAASIASGLGRQCQGHADSVARVICGHGRFPSSCCAGFRYGLAGLRYGLTGLRLRARIHH